jgi:hypothetical protein
VSAMRELKLQMGEWSANCESRSWESVETLIEQMSLIEFVAYSFATHDLCDAVEVLEGVPVHTSIH